MQATIGHSPAPEVRAPLQDRSRRTLESIARATEHLLETQPFERIRVDDILRRGRVSAGSFYARFSHKEALLPLLYARYDAELRPRVEAAIARARARSSTLLEATRAAASVTVEMYHRRRNLMRAVALYARSNPEAITSDVRARRAQIHDLVLDVFRRFANQIPHRNVGDAIRIGFFIMAAAARERVLFGDAPHASLTPLPIERLESELAHTFYAYLTTAPRASVNAGDRRGGPT